MKVLNLYFFAVRILRLHAFSAIIAAVINDSNSNQFQEAGLAESRRLHNCEDFLIMPFRGDGPISESLNKWRAKWIWIPGKHDQPNIYIFARKKFELKSTPAKAVIFCSAISHYKLYVNGKYLGRGPARNAPGHLFYDSFDITPYLKRGKNVIGFIVHNFGVTTAFSIKAPGALICQLETGRSVHDSFVATDETWKVTLAEAWQPFGVRLGEYLGFQEVYDARLSLGDWTVPAYDDSNWQEPEVLGKPPCEPFGNLEPRITPQYYEQSLLPVRLVWFRGNDNQNDILPDEITRIAAEEELTEINPRSLKDVSNLFFRSTKPAVIKCPKDSGASLLLDFGKQVFGTFELRLKGAGEGIIDLTYAESLIDQRIAYNPTSPPYSDRYIMRKGRQVWHTFEPRAFRYLQLDLRGLTGQVSIERIQVQQIAYPAPNLGSFECSDEQLNKIWNAGINTLKLCIEDSIVNTPKRERRTTWQDLYIGSRAAFQVLGDTNLLYSSVLIGLRQQNEDGSVPAWAPAPADKADPKSAMFFLWCVLECCRQTGDPDLIKNSAFAAKRLIAWLGRYVGPDGLLQNEILADNPFEDCGLNCIYRETLRRAAKILEMAGDFETASLYRDASDDIRLAINKFLWSPRAALYADGRKSRRQSDNFSRENNILALFADIPDHYQRAALIRQLEAEQSELPQIVSPFYASLLIEGLCLPGRYEEAVRIIREGWGNMAESGVFWEFFDGSGVQCRAWSLGPVADLGERILGVKPLFGNKFQIAPHSGGLSWAKGLVPTRYGNILIDWKVSARRFSMKLRIPEGAEAEVLSPITEEGVVMSVNRKIIHEASVTLNSGDYKIEVQPRPVKNATFKVPKRQEKSVKPSIALEEPAPWSSATDDSTRKRRATSRPRKTKQAEPQPETVEQSSPPEVIVESQKTPPKRVAPKYSRKNNPATTSPSDSEQAPQEKSVLSEGTAKRRYRRPRKQ